MSLGIWFRDYVYIPLGGNRCSKIRWFFNIFVVWFLTGLWHGASFNFIIWGLYFGIILVLEKTILLNLLDKLPQVFRHIYVMLLVVISFVLFDITELNRVFDYLSAMFNFRGEILDKSFFYYLVPNILTLVMGILASTPLFKVVFEKNKYIKTLVLLLGLVISTAFLVDSTFNPFLYFRF